MECRGKIITIVYFQNCHPENMAKNITLYVGISNSEVLQSLSVYLIVFVPSFSLKAVSHDATC